MSEVVVIGASAGAIESLLTVLPSLPADFRLPILAVVHLPADKPSIIPQLFQAKCSVQVKEAEDAEPIQAGTVYLAPPDYHLLTESHGHLSLSDDDPVLFSRPSIDVLFESAAEAFGPDVVGIVLTGANSDGSKGLRAIVDAGGEAIVQTPQQAYASTMPQAALDACPTARVLDLGEISAYLQQLGQQTEDELRSNR